MIGYVTLGTNDLDRASSFCDQLLDLPGAGRFMEEESFVAWSVPPDLPGLSVTRPYDGRPATAGNGNMVALVVDATRKVDTLHTGALEPGGSCEGPPGERMEGFLRCLFSRSRWH